MNKRKQELRDGVSGFRKPKQPQLFSVAADDYVAAKKAVWAPNTLSGELATVEPVA
jgi:hypothetical protein